MSLETEFYNAILYYFSEKKIEKSRTPEVNEEKIKVRLNEILKKYESSLIDFSKMSDLTLKQKKYIGKSKRRHIKSFLPSSDEDILSICVKRIIDRNFKLRFPNRNRICKELFNVLPAILQMSDFTIYRFEFSNYFNSVNSKYVFEKFISSKLSKRDEIDLLSTYTSQTHFAYAGLRPSNSIAEVIALDFDKNIKKLLFSKGLIFYERFIDDGMIILNYHMPQDEIEAVLNKAITDTFYDNSVEIKCKGKNKVKINPLKSKYLSSKSLQTGQLQQPEESNTFDFLGYSFVLTCEYKKQRYNYSIVYGISKEKRLKYIDRIKKFFRICYCNKNNTEEYQNVVLLEHRIHCFVTRQVYVLRHLKSHIWKAKGFISNYGELRYLAFDAEKNLDSETTEFLEKGIQQAFDELNLNIKSPSFLQKYNLLENLKKNKTLLFVPKIGYDKSSLEKLCSKVGVSSKSYEGLVRKYLIKMKVGY